MVMKSDEILERVALLYERNQARRAIRNRIRSIINGGAGAVRDLLGQEIEGLADLPAFNPIYSVIERTGQKLNTVPDVKILPPSSQNRRRARTDAEKRERIVVYHDQAARLKMQMPQAGRWMPGYGFTTWIIREGQTPDGFRYPKVELRDPYDTLVGYYGPGQEPNEIAVTRKVSARALARLYPKHKEKILKMERQQGGYLLGGNRGQWEGGGDVEVVTYYNQDEMAVLVPDKDLVLEQSENSIAGGHFVVAKRFSFDELTGSLDQLVGIYAHMVKGNILELMAMEDAVNTETNIIGDTSHQAYKKGRHAYNYLPAGTKVEKPVTNLPYQLFQHLDRLERYFRIQANHPRSDDGESPAAWATGRGIDSLGVGNANMIREFQTVLADALERVDAKRLEWDHRLYAGTPKPLSVHWRGDVVAERYDPSQIKGNYLTQRKYGVVAGFDEPQKIVAILQLLQAELIDSKTAQDNLDNLEFVTQVRAGVRADKAERSLYSGLEALAAQGDPGAMMALTEILDDPTKTEEILKKFFTPQEPEMSEEEAAMMAARQEVEADTVPADVQTILSRLTLSGEEQGGVQTVGRL